MISINHFESIQPTKLSVIISLLCDRGTEGQRDRDRQRNRGIKRQVNGETERHCNKKKQRERETDVIITERKRYRC
jgi:hypothetical protein